MAYVPDEFVDRSDECTRGEIRAFQAICKRADKDGACWPSLRQLAEDLKTDRGNVFRYRAGLAQKGFISFDPATHIIRVLIGFPRPGSGVVKSTTKGVVKPTTGNGGRVVKSTTDVLSDLQQPVVKLTTECCQFDNVHIRTEPAHEPAQLTSPSEPAQIKNSPSLRSGLPDADASGGPNLPGILPPEPPPSQALIHTKVRDAKPRQLDPEYETFAAAFKERFQVPYRNSKADFVQLARLRRATALAPDYWQRACVNYVTTPMGKYTLADLSTRVEVFAEGRLTQYQKPVNALDQHNARELAAFIRNYREKEATNANAKQ